MASACPWARRASRRARAGRCRLRPGPSSAPRVPSITYDQRNADPWASGKTAGEDGRLADSGQRQGLAVARDDRGGLGLRRFDGPGRLKLFDLRIRAVDHVVLAGPVLAEPGADVLGERLGVVARRLGREALRSASASTACRRPERMCQGERDEERKPQRGARAHGVSFVLVSSGSWCIASHGVCLLQFRSTRTHESILPLSLRLSPGLGSFRSRAVILPAAPDGRGIAWREFGTGRDYRDANASRLGWSFGLE